MWQQHFLVTKDHGDQEEGRQLVQREEMKLIALPYALHLVAWGWVCFPSLTFCPTSGSQSYNQGSPMPSFCIIFYAQKEKGTREREEQEPRRPQLLSGADLDLCFVL
jgi:hypothetical protein